MVNEKKIIENMVEMAQLIERMADSALLTQKQLIILSKRIDNLKKRLGKHTGSLE